MCCSRLAENTDSKKSRPKSSSAHHRTTLSGYIFATKARIDNRKKIVKQQYVLHMSPQYGDLRPTSGWDVSLLWGTPPHFNWFRVLAALLHVSKVVGVSQTLRRWIKGATYVRQGDHHVGHWPTFLVYLSVHSSFVRTFICLFIACSVGAHHDGRGNECSGEDQFIMAQAPQTLSSSNFDNAFRFSSCSIRYFQQYISTLNKYAYYVVYCCAGDNLNDFV